MTLLVEAVLLEFAGKVDAHALLPAADHALRLADPQAAEDRERKQLDEAEKRAARDRFFTLSPTAPGAPACPGCWARRPPRSWGRRWSRCAARPILTITAPPDNAGRMPSGMCAEGRR